MSAKKVQKNKKITISQTKALLFILLFAIVGVYAVVQSFAAPGGKGGGGGGKPVKNSPNGLSMRMVLDQNNDGLPNWNDQITFSIDQTATTEPHVDVVCSQNGTLVYSAWTGYFESYPWPWTQTFTLKSNAWTGGAADCTATWKYFDGRKTITGGTIVFHVNN